MVNTKKIKAMVLFGMLACMQLSLGPDQVQVSEGASSSDNPQLQLLQEDYDRQRVIDGDRLFKQMPNEIGARILQKRGIKVRQNSSGREVQFSFEELKEICHERMRQDSRLRAAHRSLEPTKAANYNLEVLQSISRIQPLQERGDCGRTILVKANKILGALQLIDVNECIAKGITVIVRDSSGKEFKLSPEQLKTSRTISWISGGSINWFAGFCGAALVGASSPVVAGAVVGVGIHLAFKRINRMLDESKEKEDQKKINEMCKSFEKSDKRYGPTHPDHISTQNPLIVRDEQGDVIAEYVEFHYGKIGGPVPEVIVLD